MPHIPVRFNISLSWVPALVILLLVTIKAFTDIGDTYPAHTYTLGDILAVIAIFWAFAGLGYIAGRFEERS